MSYPVLITRSGTHSRNPNARPSDSAIAGAGAGARPSDSAIAGVGARPSDSAIAGAQTTRGNLANYWSLILWRSKRLGLLLRKALARFFDGVSWIRGVGSIFNLIHLASLFLYGILGLTSRSENHYSHFPVYGGSLMTCLSYIVLYCTDVNELSLSVFEKGEKEGMGPYWAKVGIMGIILPTFNFFGLIIMFIKVGQNRKTFSCGIATFISYFVANILLLLKIGKKPEPEEHELRENNPPADNSTADNALGDNSPAANSPAANSPAANSPAANSPAVDSPAVYAPVHNAQVDNLLADSSPVDNLPDNSTADNAIVDYPPTDNSNG